MCWQCDHPNATIDDYFDLLRAKIRKCGWFVQYIEDDKTPFAYTIGLDDWNLPELMITAVSPQRATRLLNRVAADALRGQVLTAGCQLTIPGGPLIEIVDVDHPDAHL